MLAIIATNKPDIKSMSIKQLVTVTARGIFALLFPAMLFALLSGVAAAVAVATFKFTIQLLL